MAQSVPPASHEPRRHRPEQVVAPEEEMRQAPVCEATGQFVEQVDEGRDDAAMLPARSPIHGRVEGVQHGRPDQVGREPVESRFQPHEGLEAAVGLAPGAAVASVHLVEDVALALGGGKSPEKVRRRVEVVRVGTSDYVGDVTRLAANGTGGNQIHPQRVIVIRRCDSQTKHIH